ncbi:WD40/YVTN/BNR-like repeat-containing protein [Lewinella sp. LCG006]|uniref:WD40/YVTN/BNR-like repeat-containing protein n=1 Tax=Lewinella sp. LCG006 TaxID=3231911 RepID=UPI00345F866A
MPSNKSIFLLLFLSFVLCGQAFAQRKKQNDPAPAKEETPLHLQSSTYSALAFRSVGPAVTSGRIADFAVHPDNKDVYYVATASGGVWKTVNHGTTFTPVFDQQNSYSIGCITLDPQQPSTVWVGSGENNNQRSVGYGDGVYKSTDGGQSWEHKGLKSSEHIGDIIVDPTNSDIIWVAAYGPVWSNGGERGVYKSTDGGDTWTCVKEVSEYTGCNELVMDSRNPNVLYAAFHQRQRKVFTYIGGGPESGLFKTTDGGATWTPLKGGLPGGDVGRIGLDISPVNPNVLYAVVEADDKKGGIYRTDDAGASWSKQSGTYTSGNYYQELTCDPVDVDRIYITDTYYQISDDGGKTTRNLGELNKHIDNHAIWIDPDNTNHLLVGCDGGVYETWDLAGTWHFKSNLPVTQFYKVATDNATPFYNIHGGTQDNLSLGGPSRTTSMNGIVNADWFVTSTGDGFETQVDPTNPNIIYAQAQYGALSRYDRGNGEYYYIKPMEGENEPALRWNWDAPLLISSHNHKRLYFGANKLFRTDDQGDSWQVISPDLSAQINRNTLKVMDQVWSVDAISKNGSTDIFGQLTTIAESSIDENMLWVGTDDGLMHLTTDGGKNWQKIASIAGVPEMTYVNQIIASQHNKNTAYAAFNHHRYGDFKPYLFKTTDAGKTWTPIHATLPERGSVYTIAEDHVQPNLLFCGTEFGAFFSPDAGKHWIPLKAGLPTVGVRDMEIQKRENDLVLGTFGRGFYVLDDYSPLREITAEALAKDTHIFSVKDALLYVERTDIGLRDKGHLGSSYFTTPNPKPGAVFTYYLKESIQTLEKQRQEKEKESKDDPYPTLDQLRQEDAEEDPYLIFTIRNAQGEVVRHLKAPATKGLKRLTWDMRHNTPAPVVGRYTPAPDVLFGSAELGHLAMPGTYTVALSKFENGEVSPLTEPVSFDLNYLNQSSMPETDWAEYDAFVRKVADIRKAFSAASDIQRELSRNLNHIQSAILDMPAAPEGLLAKASELKQQLSELSRKMNGDRTLARHQFETPPSIGERIGRCEYGLWDVTSAPTQVYLDAYRIAAKQFGPVLQELKLIANEITALEKQIEMNNAPYTPGRWPEWSGQ